jgi:hypothetical protein
VSQPSARRGTPSGRCEHLAIVDLGSASSVVLCAFLGPHRSAAVRRQLRADGDRHGTGRDGVDMPWRPARRRWPDRRCAAGRGIPRGRSTASGTGQSVEPDLDAVVGQRCDESAGNRGRPSPHRHWPRAGSPRRTRPRTAPARRRESGTRAGSRRFPVTANVVVTPPPRTVSGAPWLP